MTSGNEWTEQKGRGEGDREKRNKWGVLTEGEQ